MKMATNLYPLPLPSFSQGRSTAWWGTYWEETSCLNTDIQKHVFQVLCGIWDTQMGSADVKQGLESRKLLWKGSLRPVFRRLHPTLLVKQFVVFQRKHSGSMASFQWSFFV